MIKYVCVKLYGSLVLANKTDLAYPRPTLGLTPGDPTPHLAYPRPHT